MTARWLEPLGGIEAQLAAQQHRAGYDPKAWNQLCELGLCSVMVDESFGGTQMGMEAMSALCALFGQHLLASPFFAHAMLACDLLNQSDAEPLKTQHLPLWTMGESLATVAGLGTGIWDGDALSGAWSDVPHGAQADWVILQAKDRNQNLVLALLPCDRFERSQQDTLDQSRKKASLSAQGLALDSSSIIATGEAANRLLSFTQDRAMVALAHEQVGIAQACVEASVEYAKTRRQFGEVIGKFQAIKHLIADMFTRLEAARSVALYAAWCADHQTDELPFVARSAAQLAGDASFECAGQNIQVHGGIGFTWEHPAHLFFKRAQANRHLLGSSLEHLDHASHLLGLEGG
jgi:alkylation response protein AidB-like acyl-CoA dehydrogenase